MRKLGVHPFEAQITGHKSAAVKGFSLHAGVSVRAKERKDLERLIRYVARPSIALERMEFNHDGNIVYRLKKTFIDGTTHVLFSPMELMEKLAALIPRPKIHLVRYHGVLAPHAKVRSEVVGQMKVEGVSIEAEQNGSHEKRISWARLLKRVFDIDIAQCSSCGGKAKVIAAILESVVIRKILAHLKMRKEPPKIHSARAPPQGALFEDTF